jgi:hypothetical protein
MKQTLAILAATAAIGFGSVALATTAEAQVIVVSSGGAYPPQTVSSVICETRREPIQDERGWRVRDVVTCVTR